MQTPRGSERLPEAGTQRESISELLVELANSSAALIRDELTLAKQEIREKLRQGRKSRDCRPRMPSASLNTVANGLTANTELSLAA